MDCLDEVEGDTEVEVSPPSPFAAETDDEEPTPGGQPAPLLGPYCQFRKGGPGPLRG
jgi:hypothetical protein